MVSEVEYVKRAKIIELNHKCVNHAMWEKTVNTTYFFVRNIHYRDSSYKTVGGGGGRFSIEQD